MAAEEINAAGGVLGRKLELVFAETEQSPEKGKTAVERLLFVDKVDVIIGEHRSEVALAVQPIIVENKKIFLSTGTGSPLLSERVLQDYDKYKYYFRTFLNSNQMAEEMVKQLSDMMTTYSKDKVAIITETAVWVEPIVEALKTHLGLQAGRAGAGLDQRQGRLGRALAGAQRECPDHLHALCG